MCAINPKHQHHLTISVYTSQDMEYLEFAQLVYSKLLRIEAELNQDARLRWHIKEKAAQDLEDAQIIDQLAKMQP